CIQAIRSKLGGADADAATSAVQIQARSQTCRGGIGDPGRAETRRRCGDRNAAAGAGVESEGAGRDVGGASQTSGQRERIGGDWEENAAANVVGPGARA